MDEQEIIIEIINRLSVTMPHCEYLSDFKKEFKKLNAKVMKDKLLIQIQTDIDKLTILKTEVEKL